MVSLETFTPGAVHIPEDSTDLQREFACKACVLNCALFALRISNVYYVYKIIFTCYVMLHTCHNVFFTFIFATAVLEAYSGGATTAASRRDIDLYSVNSITRNDSNLMRRDVQSRGLSTRVDRRLQTAGPPTRKRGNTFLKGATEDKSRDQGLILSEANYLTRRENIQSLIASRKEIIKKNDEYCDEERKLLKREFHIDSNNNKSIPPQHESSSAKKDKLRMMGEEELVQSVSSKRLEVLQSLHDAPTLTAINSDTALMKQKTMRNLRFVNSTNNLNGNTNTTDSSFSSGSGLTASMSLQQKLDVLEELMMNKSAGFPAVVPPTPSSSSSPTHRQIGLKIKRVSMRDAV